MYKKLPKLTQKKRQKETYFKKMTGQT